MPAFHEICAAERAEKTLTAAICRPMFLDERTTGFGKRISPELRLLCQRKQPFLLGR